MKFKDLVKITLKPCKTCFTLIYTFPCEIDKQFVTYMKSFGKSKYDLKKTGLVDIVKDGYTIRTRLGRYAVGFSMPKKFEKLDYNSLSRKPEFDKNLAEWLGKKLNKKIKI